MPSSGVNIPAPGNDLLQVSAMVFTAPPPAVPTRRGFKPEQAFRMFNRHQPGFDESQKWMSGA
jgi:hypothetical protein